MPARNDKFPWLSYYGHFNFFETRIGSHSHVSSLNALNKGIYEIALVSGKTLRVFICECYSYGTAEYFETVQALGKFDAIIINSTWCGYTPDAKHLCWNEKVGLFQIKDFMAALNKSEIWSYLNEGEAELFKNKGWL